MMAADGKTVSCLLTTEALAMLPQFALGARVRVRGQRIHGIVQKSLVVIEDVELLTEPDVDLEDLFGDDVSERDVSA